METKDVKMAREKHEEKIPAVDPDRLSLQKKDVLEFCDRVLERWQGTPPTPTIAKNIAAMVSVRTAVYFTDDDSLKAIWSEIVRWIYQLLYENAIAQGKEEKANWASTFEKLKK